MRTSAGLLLYRISAAGELELLLVHPGGPFWAEKDAGAWSVPKGEYGGGEDALAAALREFTEELGTPPPADDGRPDLELGALRQSSAKTVVVFARRGDYDADHITSNVIEIQWPPRSGRQLSFPEVDRARWCPAADARFMLVKGQVPFVDRLLDALAQRSP